jgi:hypothetical protein
MRSGDVSWFVADSRPVFEPGDAAGTAAADLAAMNERHAAAVSRMAAARWSGDAAGFAGADLDAVNERQSAAITRIIQSRPVIELGDAGGFATIDLQRVNERQLAGLARNAEHGVV